MTEIATTEKKEFLPNLRRWFLTGLVIAAPVSITGYIIYSFVDMVDDWVRLLLPIKFGKSFRIDHVFPGFGLLIVGVMLTLVGALTANVAGRQLVRFGEWAVQRMPVVGSLYSTLKQVFETVISDKSGSFREVVMVQFPHPGVWTLGFVTGQPARNLRNDLADDAIAIYVPTTPNPTGGYLIYVSRAETKAVDMTVDEALKYIVSLGIAGDPANAPVPFKPKKKAGGATA